MPTNNPRIVIRTDIGGPHGYGHASRCLALAHVLRNQGADVFFTTSTGLLQSYVEGFSCYHGGESPQQCAGHNTIHVIDTKATDWANDEASLSFLHRHGAKIVRIDHPHATPDSCDLLIGPCAHWSRKTVSKLQTTFGARFLYGWPYAMLTPDVTAFSPIPYAERTNGPIVFCAGGSDPSGALQRMYDWTQTMPSAHLLLFAVGEQADEPAWRGSRTAPTQIQRFKRSMLREASGIVSMFGQTCYEALWYRTPLFTIGHTEENVEGAAILARKMQYGVLDLRMPIYDMSQNLFLWRLETFFEWRERFAERMPHVLDGQGIDRIAKAILALET